MSAIETVRIESDAEGTDGFIVINKSDFDPEKHTLFDEEPEDDSGSKWTVKTLKARLAELGTAIPRNASKAELIALLPAEEQ